jgi:hypothetical protein
LAQNVGTVPDARRHDKLNLELGTVDPDPADMA